MPVAQGGSESGLLALQRKTKPNKSRYLRREREWKVNYPRLARACMQELQVQDAKKRQGRDVQKNRKPSGPLGIA